MSIRLNGKMVLYYSVKIAHVVNELLGIIFE